MKNIIRYIILKGNYKVSWQISAIDLGSIYGGFLHLLVTLIYIEYLICIQKVGIPPRNSGVIWRYISYLYIIYINK